MPVTTFVTRLATITIATDDTTSDAVPTNGGRLILLKMPAGFTAGNVDIEGSLDGTTWGQVVYVTGANVVATSPAVDEIVSLGGTVQLQGFTHLRLVTSAQQLADRVFSLVFEE